MVKDTGAHSTAADWGASILETLHPSTALAKLLRRRIHPDKHALCVSTTQTPLQAKQAIADKTFISAWTESTAQLRGRDHISSHLRIAAVVPRREPLSQAQPNVPLANEDSCGLQCIRQQTMPQVSLCFKFQNSTLGMFQDRKHITKRWKEMYRETVHRVLLHEAVTGTWKQSLNGKGQSGWSRIVQLQSKKKRSSRVCSPQVRKKTTVNRICVHSSLLTLQMRASLNIATHYKKFLQILKCIKVSSCVIMKVKKPHKICSQSPWKSQKTLPQTAAGFESDTSFATRRRHGLFYRQMGTYRTLCFHVRLHKKLCSFFFFFEV